MKTIALLLLCSGAMAQTPDCPTSNSHLTVEDGMYASGPGVEFKLHRFAATLVARGPRVPLCLVKTTVVSHADIFVSNESLTAIFGKKLENSESKIKEFRVENGLDSVTLSGSIVKLIPLHFSLAGKVGTDGTAIILTVDKLKADGIPIKGLLELIGKHLNDVLGLNGVVGVTVGEDTISFLPEKIAHVKGHLSSVVSSEAGLALHYGAAPRTHRSKNRKP